MNKQSEKEGGSVMSRTDPEGNKLFSQYHIQVWLREGESIPIEESDKHSKHILDAVEQAEEFALQMFEAKLKSVLLPQYTMRLFVKGGS